MLTPTPHTHTHPTPLKQISNILASAAPLLGDLSGFRDFKTMSRELISKLTLHEKERFQEWSSTTQDELRDGDLSLEMTGRVMDFDVAGKPRA